MKFYTSIADLYDEIFPFKPPQKSFVESFGIHGYNSHMLDVGCGTGSLCLNLAESFGTIIGIDPDLEMLRLAKLKAMKFKADHRDKLDDMGNWVFLQKGMLDLSDEFVPGSFNTVLCFGNTLVHLSSAAEVRLFLKQSYDILKPGGCLMIQVINYDRIYEKGLKGLPTLENEKMKFERHYHYEADSPFVDFHTILTDKRNGVVIDNDIPLLALRPAQLKKMIEESGFADISEYGNFKKEAFTKDSQPYIVVATK